jgi:hypothetical protein
VLAILLSANAAMVFARSGNTSALVMECLGFAAALVAIGQAVYDDVDTLLSWHKLRRAREATIDDIERQMIRLFDGTSSPEEAARLDARLTDLMDRIRNMTTERTH